MDPRRQSDAVRQASGLPHLSVLTDPVRVARVREIASGAAGSLADSLCTVTVLSGDVLVAADAQAHPWLLDLPPVVSGAVRNYLGVPLLLADGTAVGALCVYGPEPREWSDRDVGLTCDIADIVTLELQRLVGAPDPAPTA